MKTSWTKPSLSRDFTILSAVIVLLLLLTSLWVSYETYVQHKARVESDLAAESVRIEKVLAKEMISAGYMLSALGTQIVIDNKRDLSNLAKLLKSFDSKGYIYSILSWVDPEKQLVVSSNMGILETPVDLSDRDYVQKAQENPWVMQIGRPIEGRVSGKWVIPVSMGLTDYTGKFIGSITISIDINTLTEQISSLVKREGISFAVVSQDSLIPLAQVADEEDFIERYFPKESLLNISPATNSRGIASTGNFLFGDGIYTYYYATAEYPYFILLGYDERYSEENIASVLWMRQIQMIMIAGFFVAFLGMMRARVIKPIINITEMAASVAKGDLVSLPKKSGPLEILGLSKQINQISAYISENKRIEQELRHKITALHNANVTAENRALEEQKQLKQKSEEVQTALNHVRGFVQVMKDQMFGPIENKKYKEYISEIDKTIDAAQKKAFNSNESFSKPRE